MYGFFNALSRVMAYIGGLMLSALIVLTCISVFGRSLNGLLNTDLFQNYLPAFSEGLIDLGIGPINGDYELVQAGMAFVIFAFLPLCQLTASHACVDVFTSMLGDGANRVLRMISEIVLAVVLIVIAIQLASGMMSKFRSGQTTFLLEFPVWWAYAVSLIGASVACLVGVYVAFVRVLEVIRGQPLLPDDGGAEH